MAKLVILLAAVFGVLLVVANAHRTIVTVDEEEKNPGIIGSLICDRQIRRAGYISQCLQMLREEDEPEESYYFEGCCSQLRQVADNRCRCKALTDFVRHEVQLLPEEMKQPLVERARQLPQLCGLERGCQQMRALNF